MSAGDPDSTVDGRHLRAERSRTAVVDAMLALFDEGIMEPSAAEIAERAGVSQRSVFRHFDDLEALATTAIARQFGRVEHLFEPPSTEGDQAARITALVQQRCRLYERMANLARVALQRAGRSAVVANAVEARRVMLRSQVADSFAGELLELTPRDRRLLLAALDAACSFEAIDYLRTSAGIGPRDLPVVVGTNLEALLAHRWGPVAGATGRRSSSSRPPA